MKTKRTIIHEKLEKMKFCYQQRSLDNLDLIYETFFDDARPAILLGTDNGELFRTKEQIYELFTYDWQHWGDVSIDPWGFTVTEAGPYTLARVKALLDFHEDRAWDIDILMVFEEYNEGLVCRLMMFKVPRNIIRPTVILNHSEEEMNKYRTEQEDLRAMYELTCSAEAVRPVQEHALQILHEQIAGQRPDWTSPAIPEDQLLVFCGEDGYFYFAGTGVCTPEGSNDLLPFRIIGLGRAEGESVTIEDSELSHPFFCTLG